MDSKKFVIATLVGTVVNFTLGGLIYGLLLAQFFAEHMGAVPGVAREQPLMWAIAVSELAGATLLALLIGSEGTLAVVTKVVVRILRKPESVATLLAAYDSIPAAGSAVSDIIAAGIIPAAVEIMDGCSLEAVEAAVHPNFPPAIAILIVELDGPATEVDEQFQQVESICRRVGATTVELAKDDAHRARIWKGRKGAFASMGRITPNYYVQDGVVPRTKLPEVLERIHQLEARCGLRIGNVFHAGDGNLHPLICYDESIPGQADLAAEVGGEILGYCVEAGSVSSIEPAIT